MTEATTTLTRAVTRVSDTHWHSLQYFNIYRITIATVLLAIIVLFGPVIFGAKDPRLFLLVALLNFMFAVTALVTIRLRWPPFIGQLSAYIFADVICLTLLIYASGGLRSGLGFLIIVTLAATGMIGRGRLALFHAAVATLAILFEESYRIVEHEASADYIHAATMSMGFFATAWASHVLARRATASEQVAQEQSVDLANLAQVNQLIIKDMDNGVLVVDETGRVRQHNIQAERLLGGARRIAEERSLADYSPDLARRFAAWRDGLASHADSWRAAGNRQLRATFVPLGAQRSRGAVIFLEDASRLQEQARQLKLAALGRLTANIAHEIRNPLSSISYATELLGEEAPANPTQARLLQIIADNTRRLDRMVKEVLQLNQRDRAEPREIDARAWAEQFVEEFSHGEKLPPGALLLDVDGDSKVCFDPAHLNQVLWNLCRNAWRHSRQGAGSLRLRVTPANERDVIYWDVIDDGPGVEESARAKLFEPFFTTSSQGTGLGLYIAREICEANGAILEYVDSGAGGAQFRIVCKGGHC